jgi:hypothetical protein
MSNDFFEKTLEQIIIQNQKFIHKKGFPRLLDNTHSQFQLPSGGKIDILSFAIDETYDSISYKIFELKRETIQVDALCQVSQYASELYMLSCPHFKHVNIERYVVGTDYSKQVLALMESQISIDIYLYKYTIDGIAFKQASSYMEAQNEEVNKLLYSTSQESLDLYNTIWTLNNNLNKEAKNSAL